MSILEQYGKLPTVEEMMAALASPIVPKSASTEQQAELSTDEMVKQMFSMMQNQVYNNPGDGGGSGGCC